MDALLLVRKASVRKALAPATVAMLVIHRLQSNMYKVPQAQSRPHPLFSSAAAQVVQGTLPGALPLPRHAPALGRTLPHTACPRAVLGLFSTGPA